MGGRNVDKITRILLLYSKLIQGERINKILFSFETEISQRSFDRDIEDVRLFLEEIYSTQELKYDRISNEYFLEGSQRQKVEEYEFSFIKRAVLDAGVLRKDETEELLLHIADNTEGKQSLKIPRVKEAIEDYKEPDNKTSIIKLHGDLEKAIYNRSVISVNYLGGEKTEVIKILPCELKCKENGLYLYGYCLDEISKVQRCFDLKDLESFNILRSQLKEEREMVENYKKLNKL